MMGQNNFKNQENVKKLVYVTGQNYIQVKLF